MKVVVTGSEGFVGKELANALIRRSHQVERFDVKLGHNILDKGAVEKAVTGADAVYHLAAQLDEGAKDLFEVNVQGTKNVLEACEKARVKQLIYLSTVGVMGKLKHGQCADENTPINPETNYEKSKADAEKAAQEYLESIPLTIVRAAFVIGPSGFWTGIIKQAKHNFPLVGEGKNKWQVIYYRDLADALVFLLGKEDAMGEIFIIAEDKGVTLRELYIALRKELGVTEGLKTISPLMAKAVSWIYFTGATITHKKTVVMPAHIDRLERERCYSTKKINALGWHAKTSTMQAVAETVKALEGKDKK
ncbi:MAG: NAD(P)-dependent oxidoreductase [Candidatus Diapherotrites archaeon]|nr:NAD(P)-dependent oxidoreductase [Candidatus Micrarchaeota archaeon]